MTEKEFIQKSAEEIKGKLKKFPKDFLETERTEIFNCNGQILILGAEFFGYYDLINPNGETVLQLPDFETAKYYIYASLSKPQTFPVPVEKEDLLKAVKNYERYLDGLMREVKEKFEANFPQSPNSTKAITKIFRTLNLQRY